MNNNSKPSTHTTSPHNNDVLFGRGGTINSHPGNEQYRTFVERKKREYLLAHFKREKRRIAQSIVDEVRNLYPPGRFLLKDSEGVWRDVGDERARGKISQALREKSAAIRKQMEDEFQQETTRQPYREVAIAAGLYQEEAVGNNNMMSANNNADILLRGGGCPLQGQTSMNAAMNYPYCAHPPQQSGAATMQQQHVQAGIQQQHQQQSYCGAQDNVQQVPNEQYHQMLLQLQQSHNNNTLQLPQHTNITQPMIPPPSQGSLQSSTNEWEPISLSNIGNELDGSTRSHLERNANIDLKLNGEDSLQQNFNLGEEENALGLFDDLFDIDGEDDISSLDRKVSLGQDDDDSAAEQKQLHELTLHEWVIRCKSKILGIDKIATQTMASDQVLRYIKAALPIAIQVTEILIEAEKDELQGREENPISLESIVAENVLIRLRANDQHEVIEHAWIMSSIGDPLDALMDTKNPDTGTVKARLCAMGHVLYELFTGYESTSLLNVGSSMQAHDAGGDVDISASQDENDNHGRKKKPYQRQPAQYNCIARLGSKGYPFSLCALVNNLLNCGEGEYCDGGDAYTSFHDLRADLRLMLDDPSRFLDDLQVSNGLPTLEICDKLYGREREEEKLDQLYQQHIIAKAFKGVIISGGAGIGKSRLAMHIQKLSTAASGYFYTAKFQQNNMHVKPLSTLGALFNSLCDRFAEDASPLQLRSISDELVNALGNQAGLLAGVVPSLLKLMPCRSIPGEMSSACIDAPSSMRYLFGELLRVISSHSSRSISLLIDDIQFADSSSLLLISSLLFSTTRSDSSVFFAFCHRDNDPGYDSGMFDVWMTSISMYSLERIKLDNMTVEGVNSLVSDTLHLSPRITRPLSTVLHHKTTGNPLFLRQLLVSLTGQGYINVDFGQPRWVWDLKKITDQEISESVLGLLINDMKRLPTNLQLGLKVASCLGSCVQKNVLVILSGDVGLDLPCILQQVSKKGFMTIEDDGATFSFVHDKIQQAAYELVSEQQRRRNHMQYGMALCSHTLDNNPDNNELFFTAVNQINSGGPSVISDPSKRAILAKLNLKAGKLSITLSDYATALSLFEHGISYLGDDKWTSEYELTLNLFDLGAEAACVLNKNDTVTSYTEQLVAHAKSFDDSLNCLAVAAKCLHQVGLLKQSMESSMGTLSKLGEQPLRDISDNTLHTDMMTLNETLRNTPDESILNLHENKTKKNIITLKILSNLYHVLHFVKPSFLGAVSLRMVKLTMDNGLVSSSPLAFGYYGEVLVANGSVKEGCRFGRLALKLVENKLSLVHKSAVFATVYHLVLWASDPLQSTIESHEIGRKVGQQSGDFLYSSLNWQMSNMTSYFAGVSLDKVQTNAENFILTMQSQNGRMMIGAAIFYYHQPRVLKEGMIALDAKPPNNILTEKEALEKFNSPLILSSYKIHQLARAYLFRQFDDVESLDIVDISGDIERNKHPPRALFVSGIFFEGLTSFLLARQASRDSERLRWIDKGENVLTKMRYWSEHSSWNWEDKMVLLEAEKMYTMRNFDQAALLYERSIRLAHEHKFINDEAIASELAGIFFCDRGLRVSAEALLLHSVQCYKTWGALAVAKRVETLITNKYGSILSTLDERINMMRGIFLLPVSREDFSSSKKRQASG